MNKKQLIDNLQSLLSETGTIYPKWELNEIVESFLAVVSDSLKQGQNVSIVNFGKFVVKLHKSRSYYNINKGQMEHTLEKRSIVFTPNKSLHRLTKQE